MILQGLPQITKRTNKLVNSHTIDCVICLQNLHDGQRLLALQCAHVFHQLCIASMDGLIKVRLVPIVDVQHEPIVQMPPLRLKNTFSDSTISF